MKVHLKLDVTQIRLDQAWRRWRSYRRWIRVNPELWNRLRFNSIFFAFLSLKAYESEIEKLKLEIFENDFEFQFYSRFGFGSNPIAGRNKELYDEIKRSIYERLEEIASECDLLEFDRDIDLLKS